MLYLDQTMNEHEKDEYYLANLTSMLWNVNRGKGVPSRDLKDFLLKFTAETPKTKEDKLRDSKSFWEFHTGKKATPRSN